MKKAAALTASFAILAALGLGSPAASAGPLDAQGHESNPPFAPQANEEPTVHRTPIRVAEPLLESDAPSGLIAGEIVIDVADDASDEEIADLGRKYGISMRDNSPGIKHDGNIALADMAEA